VTIFNDQAASNSAPEHSRSSSKQHRTSSKHRQSSEQRKHKRSSSEDDIRHRRCRAMQKSKQSPEGTVYAVDVPVENGKKSTTSRGIEIDCSDSSDELSLVSVKKRLSRGKTVRMYRTVKKQSDDDDDGNDGALGKPSRHVSKTALIGVSKGKTLSSSQKKRSVKQSSAVSESRKVSVTASAAGQTSQRHTSQRKHNSSSRKQHKLSKLPHGKRHKPKL